MELTPGASLGRGRGLALALDSERLVGKLGFDSGLDMNDSTPVVKPESSTPTTANRDTLEQLRDLLEELGTQIGDSVVSRILATLHLTLLGVSSIISQGPHQQ